MMKTFTLFFIFLALTLQGCVGQSIPKREVYNKDFNWTITIPEDFENVSVKEWKKMQNRGAQAIEQTINEEVINETKTIFVFKSDQLNYFESSYETFDTSTDGDYLTACKSVIEVLYQTFINQMPGINIDTSSTVETIDNLQFQCFKLKVLYPNQVTLNALMYCRLFDKQDLTVNIIYVDPKKGKAMLDALKKSKFNT
jgi:hypothetical protein